MNTREKNVLQAIEGVGMMHRALDSLSREVLPVNPQRFAVMAEGPIDQIRDLLNQIDSLMTEPIEGDSTVEDEAVAQRH
jgi:hypothetical protein